MDYKKTTRTMVHYHPYLCSTLGASSPAVAGAVVGRALSMQLLLSARGRLRCLGGPAPRRQLLGLACCWVAAGAG